MCCEGISITAALSRRCSELLVATTELQIREVSVRALASGVPGPVPVNRGVSPEPYHRAERAVVEKHARRLNAAQPSQVFL